MSEYARALKEREESEDQRKFWDGDCLVCGRPRLACRKALDALEFRGGF